MSQAQELLNSLADQPAVSIANTNAEEHIVIGRDRVIVIPASLKRLGVQYDHNIETVTFDCPRFWDEHDLSQMEIYINYMLPNNTVGGDVAKNIAIVGDSISFDWTITNNVTQYKGSLAILVCAKKTDEDGNKINHWNSELNREAYISEGMDCGDVIAMEYPDIITELLTRMDVLENNAPSASPGSSGIYVGSEEPTDPNVELWVNPDDDEVQTFIKSPATASVGQTIVVKSVDENGKPTEWEAVDMPSGGSGWTTIISHIVTEECKKLEFTNDIDGNPLDFTGVSEVLIMADGTGVCGDGYYLNTKIGDILLSSNVQFKSGDTIINRAWIHAVYRDGMWAISKGGAGGQTYASYSYAADMRIGEWTREPKVTVDNVTFLSGFKYILSVR